MSNHLSILDKEQLSLLTNIRIGEIKIGQQIHLVDSSESWEECLAESSASFVLLGIPEDVGVRANGGIGGTQSVWIPALQSLLNIQSTSTFTGKELLILGSLDCKDWLHRSQGMNLDQLRDLVAEIDEAVYPVIQKIVEANKIPIIIGGGHNNAFPIIKGASLARGQSINCINLDAHSDYRVMEGRHSGNAFRYARSAKYLNRYAMVGLHQNYNSETVLADMNNDPNLQYSFFEDIFVHGRFNFEESVQRAIDFTHGLPRGIELDLDCIQNVLSSAATPLGISVLQARQYVNMLGYQPNCIYFHLTEGATQLANGQEDRSTGKLISYLVSDFVRSYNTRKGI